jgi:ketosteroid isomerase-like protein
MSQENVEIVLASFEAWNARDMDAFRELYDPDAILRMDANWPEPGPYVGREAVMREFEQLRQTWDGRDTSEPIGDFIDVYFTISRETIPPCPCLAPRTPSGVGRAG